jgi:hypothetical protein
MAYRNDLEALQARHVALAAEVAERTRARDEVAQLLAEARAQDEAERRRADIAAGGPARRRRHRILIAAAATALAMVAGSIGYGIAHRKHDRLAEAIDRLAEFTDEMCACPDTACTKKVSDEMSEWSMRMAKQFKPVTIDESSQTRVNAIVKRMSSCMVKTTAGQPMTAP